MCERRLHLQLMIWLLLAGYGPALWAQTTTPPQKAAEQEPPIRIITNEVRLPLRAFDALGEPVTDLTAKEIIVSEDGAGCPVTSLKFEPANVLLVLDLSNTLGPFKSGRSEDEKKRTDWTNYSVIARPAAYEFAASLARQLAALDQLALLQYADRVELLQEWTHNQNDVLNALRAKFRVGLKARFHDALARAAAQLQTAPAGRRVLVLVTDGVDTASTTARQAAFAQVLATGASVFVVSWTEIILGEAQQALRKAGFSLDSTVRKRAQDLRQYRQQAQAAADDLKMLAAASGGEYWAPATFRELNAQPQAVIRELGAQYTLTYLSRKDQLAPAARAPEILLARPGLTARTRQATKGAAH